MRHAKAGDTSNAAAKGGGGEGGVEYLHCPVRDSRPKALLLQPGKCCATLHWAQLHEGPEPRQAALVRLIRWTSFATYC